MRIEQCRAGQAVSFRAMLAGGQGSESQVIFARILRVGVGQVYLRTEKGKRKWMRPADLRPAPEGEHFLPQWEGAASCSAREERHVRSV